ncbi:MAG: potassium channel family protein [Pyrinomonadaceae bacterium]
MSDLKQKITRATDSFGEIILYYILVLGLSGLAFSYLEDKPILESMWWACVTGMTIGYGDIYPVTVGGKFVAIFLMHVVPLIIIPLIVARLLIHVIEDQHKFSHDEQEEMKQDIKLIKTALGLDKTKTDED